MLPHLKGLHVAGLSDHQIARLHQSRKALAGRARGSGGGRRGRRRRQTLLLLVDNWSLPRGSTADDSAVHVCPVFKHVLKSLRVLSIVELAQLRVRGGHGSRPLDQQQAAVCTLPNHNLHTVLPVGSTHKAATSQQHAWDGPPAYLLHDPRGQPTRPRPEPRCSLHCHPGRRHSTGTNKRALAVAPGGRLEPIEPRPTPPPPSPNNNSAP